MEGTMRFSLDRTEGDVAVCYTEQTDRREKYDFSLTDVPALRGLADGTHFEATLGEDGLPYDIRILSDETEARRASNKARLAALFARGKTPN
jgi:hypothetical protein